MKSIAFQAKAVGADEPYVALRLHTVMIVTAFQAFLQTNMKMVLNSISKNRLEDGTINFQKQYI